MEVADCNNVTRQRRPPTHPTCSLITEPIPSARSNHRTINTNARPQRQPLAVPPRHRRWPLRPTATRPLPALTLKQVITITHHFLVIEKVHHQTGLVINILFEILSNTNQNQKSNNQSKNGTATISHNRCCLSFRCHFGWRFSSSANTQPSGIRHCS